MSILLAFQSASTNFSSYSLSLPLEDGQTKGGSRWRGGDRDWCSSHQEKESYKEERLVFSSEYISLWTWSPLNIVTESIRVWHIECQKSILDVLFMVKRFTAMLNLPLQKWMDWRKLPKRLPGPRRYPALEKELTPNQKWWTRAPRRHLDSPWSPEAEPRKPKPRHALVSALQCFFFMKSPLCFIYFSLLHCDGVCWCLIAL